LMALKAIELWFASPVWGHGYASFGQLSGFETYSHSTFTEVLCNGGLVGGILIAMFYLLPVRDLVRKIRSTVDPPDRTFAISLLVFWALFMLFSIFAVMFESRDYIPMCAAICGYLQEERSPVRENLRPARRRKEGARRRAAAAERTPTVSSAASLSSPPGAAK
jgi:O-antigen ligase